MIITNIVKVLLVVVSLVGLLITVGHYLPLPQDVQEGKYYPAPGKEWFVGQLKLYSDNAILAATHIVPSMLLMFLLPFQLSARIREKAPLVHKTCGIIMALMIMIITVSSIILSIVMPFGDWTETLAAVTISLGSLLCLGFAIYRIKNKNISSHRLWMSYMLAFVLSPISMRVAYIIGMEGLSLNGRDIFGVSMFIGLAINLTIVRWWLARSSRYQAAAASL